MNKPNPIPLVSIAVSLTPSVLPIHAKEVRCPDSCWDRRVSGLRGRPNGGFSEAHDKPRVMRTLLFLMKVLQRARFNGSFIIHTVTTGGVWPFSCTWLHMFYRKWLQGQLAWRFEILRENVTCLPLMNLSRGGTVPFRSLLHSNARRSLISLSPRMLQLADCAR